MQRRGTLFSPWDLTTTRLFDVANAVNATHILTTPRLLEMHVGCPFPQSLEYICLGGEAMSEAVVDMARGATSATHPGETVQRLRRHRMLCVSIHARIAPEDAQEGERHVIGAPLAGVEYTVDANSILTISGDFVCSARKTHCTGDIVKRSNDGTLVLVGRQSGDSQIKINGIRTSRDGVGCTISRCSLVKRAYVNLVRGELVCCVELDATLHSISLSAAERASDTSESLNEMVMGVLREHADCSLPSHARPSFYVSIAEGIGPFHGGHFQRHRRGK